MAVGAAEVEPVDADRQVAETLGPGRFGPIRSGCSSPWQKSPAGAPNMVFMWYGANVMWRIWMSLKLGAYRPILSTTRCAISFFSWPCCPDQGLRRCPAASPSAGNPSRFSPELANTESVDSPRARRSGEGHFSARYERSRFNSHGKANSLPPDNDASAISGKRYRSISRCWVTFRYKVNCD